MRHTPERHRDAVDWTVKDIHRKERKRYSFKEKNTDFLAGLRDEDTIIELYWQEGIVQNCYYSWSKGFMEAGRQRLAGDTVREANTREVQWLGREARDLKDVVAEQALELRLFKKISMPGDGEDIEWGVLHPRSWELSGWWNSPTFRLNKH